MLMRTSFVAFALLTFGCGDPTEGEAMYGDSGSGGLAARLAHAVVRRDAESYRVVLLEAGNLRSAPDDVLQELEHALEREIESCVHWPDPPGVHPTAPLLVRLGQPGVLAFLRAYEPALSRRAPRMYYAPYFMGTDAQGEDPYGFHSVGWATGEALLELMRDETNSPGLRYGAGEVLAASPASVSVLAMVPLLDMLDEWKAAQSETQNPSSDDSLAYWTLSRIVTRQPGTSLASVLDAADGDTERQLVWLILHCGHADGGTHPVGQALSEQLRRCLSAPYRDTRLGAATILAAGGDADELVLSVLRAALRLGEQTDRMWAAFSLIGVQGDSDELLAVLLQGMQCDRVRSTAEALLTRSISARDSTRSRLKRMVIRDAGWMSIRVDVLRLLLE